MRPKTKCFDQGVRGVQVVLKKEVFIQNRDPKQGKYSDVGISEVELFRLGYNDGIIIGVHTCVRCSLLYVRLG